MHMAVMATLHLSLQHHFPSKNLCEREDEREKWTKSRDRSTFDSHNYEDGAFYKPKS